MTNSTIGPSGRTRPRLRKDNIAQPVAESSGLLIRDRNLPGNLLLVAIWFGSLTGILELVQLYVRNQLNGSVWLGILRMNRHYGWMIPVSNLVVFVAAGLVLAIAASLVPRIATWLSYRVFGLLAALALLLTIKGLYAIASVSLAVAIAHRLARRLGTPYGPLPAWLRGSLPVLLLIELSLAGVCSLPLVAGESRTRSVATAATAMKRPNILLIVMDTVRASSLSLHGYDRNTSPNLARLAQRGVVFEQARSTAPWTFPSHATMFTGCWPHELNVAENRPLGTGYPTLAEYLADSGYRTGGFVANTFFCNSWYGLARGFDRYEDFYDDDVAISVSETLHCSTLGQLVLKATGVSTMDHRVRKDAARINADFLDWLSQSDSRPYFAFLNYFDAHSPYLLPPGQGRRLGTTEPTAEELKVLQTWDERPKQQVSPEHTQLIRDAYDECIAYLDEQIGRLFDELERRGSLKDTVVIVTSDHGEQLGEHELFGHGKSLYGQETHVPLIVLPPDETADVSSVSEPVSLRDIPATVLDLLGAGHSERFPGASLSRHWRTQSGTARGATSPAFSEVNLRTTVSRNRARPPAWRGPMQSLAVKDRAYIHNADDSEELHDIFNDSLEERNLVGNVEEEPVIKRMRALLRAVQAPETNSQESN